MVSRALQREQPWSNRQRNREVQRPRESAAVYRALDTHFRAIVNRGRASTTFPLTPAFPLPEEREIVRPPSLDSSILDFRSPRIQRHISINVECWTLSVTRHNVRHQPFALCSLPPPRTPIFDLRSANKPFATFLCALGVSVVQSRTVTVIEGVSPQRHRVHRGKATINKGSIPPPLTPHTSPLTSPPCPLPVPSVCSASLW